MIFWGLTPLQSSIFATRTIEKSLQVAAVTSTAYLSLQDQKRTLTGSYAQSSYNIAWLNESLPPFMNRQGMLAPFSLAQENNKLETSETWTAPTHYYSVDINCKAPITDVRGSITSSWGCHYNSVNMNVPHEIKDNQYSLLYVGYWYEESMDSYLGNGECPEQANQTFLIRWGRGRKNLTNSVSSPYPIEGATLWCRPTYCTLRWPMNGLKIRTKQVPYRSARGERYCCSSQYEHLEHATDWSQKASACGPGQHH